MYINNGESYYLGDAIRRRMQAQGLKGSQLADLAGISRENVYHWLHGHSSPSANSLPVIANALGCTIEDLYEDYRI